MNKFEKLCLIMEIGGAIGLTVIAFKAERERHKAVMKTLDTMILNGELETQHMIDQGTIVRLEKELAELKSEKEEEA